MKLLRVCASNYKRCDITIDLVAKSKKQVKIGR